MKISYNWLSQYVQSDLDHSKISDILTDIGLEVEGVDTVGHNKNRLDTVLVGRVDSLKPHPNADRLKIAMVDLGKEELLQIVCGAPNINEEQKVPVATIGTVLHDKSGKDFKIKKSKIRGEESFGMICSEAELGIGNASDGIMVLKPNTKVGTALSELYKTKEDFCFEIGLTPNRSDAMSHYGVARDLNAALQVRKQNSAFFPVDLEKFNSLQTEDENPIEIEVVDQEKCPRYCGISLENIQVKESPDWIKERLLTIGITPKNNVVDITNYVLHDLGQPLHAFDADKIIGNKILVKTQKEGTKFTTLEGKERILSDQDLMICNQENGMCIAGVLGGLESGVTEKTSKIFLESAYFHPVSIRKTAKHHTINTDASFRFERQVDPNSCLDGLKLACILLVEYANAKVVGKIEDIYPKPIERTEVVLRGHRLNLIAGQRIHKDTVKQILNTLEIEILSEHNDVLTLLIPTYRADVTREIDVIEDILRIYGYNNIKTSGNIVFSLDSTNNKQPIGVKENVISDLLVANGFLEAMNNSLTKQKYSAWFQEQEAIQILNPLSHDLSVMRQSLLLGLLENVAYNINRNQPNLKLYEFGKTYSKYQKKYYEETMLGILVTGNSVSNHWSLKNKQSGFFQLKGLVNQILQRLNIVITDEIPIEETLFEEGILILKNETPLVKVGKVNYNLNAKIDVKQDVFYAEIFWEKLLPLAANQQFKYQEIPKFPGAKRDLALLIPTETTYNDLYKIAFETEQSLLKSVELFDVYEGDKLPEGKKSYALSFFLQKEGETLTEEEIETVMNQLIANYKSKLNVELRN